jgi:hypothetical protein
MELLVTLALLVALTIGAEVWGAESREGFTSVVKPARWFVAPWGHREPPVESGPRIASVR